MIISEVMTPDVRVASPDDSLQSAACVMEAEGFGSLPVGCNDRLVGMVTDRDITIRAVARGLTPQRCKVRDVMSTGVRYVYDYETVDYTALKMADFQVRRLPVLNRYKRLVGIVSLGDLALTTPRSAGAALRSIAEGRPDDATTQPLNP